MKKSHSPSSTNRAWLVALLISAALLLASCSRSGSDSPLGGAGSDGKTASGSRTGMKSRDDVRSMANDQGAATAPDKGNFKIVYTPTENPKYAEMNESLRRSGELEVVADELNASLSIPEDVTITFKECGEVNASWNPPSRTINMCYELVEYFAETFKNNARSEEELNQIVSGATTFTFFHELGHGLVDILQLPATGKEEDAVDQLSTFILLSTDQEEGGQMVLSGAQWFWNNFQQTRESGAGIEKLNWADEHSMDGARAFNIICWTFGSNPRKYSGLINAPLPERRAVRCPTEYSRLSRAWLNLLKPYLKDAGRRALEQQQQQQGGEAEQEPGQATAGESSEEGDQED